MPLLRRAKLLLLAAALAVPARAAVVVAPTTVYSAPAGFWSGPLVQAFSDPATLALLPPGLRPGLSSPELTPQQLKQAAPLVLKIERALEITPGKFAALTPADKKGAVELAVEEAREELRQKIYEESETARRLSSSGKGLDKQGRADLYASVARLMEMREHYRGWFADPGKKEDEEEAPELQALDGAYAAAAATAWKARTDLLDPGALTGEKTAAKTAAKAPAPFVLKPTVNAAKLREEMENNKSGWGQNDLHALYTGWGFELREGGKHRFYSHPVFPQLHESVSRQNDLPPGYAHSALKLIAELERLAAPKAADGAPAAAFPATLTLADLSVLLSPPAAAEPEPVPERVEEKTRPRGPPTGGKSATILVEDRYEGLPPEPPVILVPKQARLDPPAERESVAKPELPAPDTATPDKPASVRARIGAIWGKLKKTKPD